VCRHRLPHGIALDPLFLAMDDMTLLVQPRLVHVIGNLKLHVARL